MRTTLTLDDDVAALLESVQAKRKAGLKQVVNEALRAGLVAMSAPRERPRVFRSKTIVKGPPSLPDLSNIAEVLAAIEGERHK